MPAGVGPPCRRCGELTAVMTHATITAKMLAQPYYYAKWYRCENAACKTTLIMPEEHRVFCDGDGSRQDAGFAELAARLKAAEQPPAEPTNYEPPPWDTFPPSDPKTEQARERMRAKMRARHDAK
jgi:hypothetical protein